MKKSFLILFSLLIALSSCSQKKIKEGHKITFDFKGLENQEILLAYHYAGKHYISDTILLNEKGIGHLEGPENKPKGVYLVVVPSMNNKYAEFLVSDQYFTFKTTSSKFGVDMQFVNSKENEIFLADMKEMNDLRKKADKMRKGIPAGDATKKKEVNDEITELNKVYLKKRNKIAEDNPKMFYSDLLGLMKEIDIPEPEKKENGELVDSSFGWNYWKKHYWDYTDFSEEGILRTPIFHNKLIQFLTKRTEPNQDSVIASSHRVLAMAQENEEVFKYTLSTILNRYANSKIMGDDAIYVDLVKNYYEKGLAPWTDSAQLVKMVERANALSPLSIGKISPNLLLRDTTLKMKYRLHDLPSDYTIVFIWDPECGHCKKTAPILNDFYKKYKNKSILIYSISTANYQELDAWKDFIESKDLHWINVADPYNETNFRKIYDISSTPQIFVLDKDKKIIAKRIGANQLEQFFFNYFKKFDKEKFVGMEGLTFEKADSTKH